MMVSAALHETCGVFGATLFCPYYLSCVCDFFVLLQQQQEQQVQH